MNALIAAVCGLGTAIGILGVVTAMPAWRARQRTKPDTADPTVLASSTNSAWLYRPWTRKAALAVATGSVVGVATRWPVAGILGMLASTLLPTAVRRTSPAASSRRAEAVAGWTELVRDALAASAGLAQAIVVTAPSAPTPIRGEVSVLASRLTAGVPMTVALREFANDVDDPSAEFLVCALLLAATARAQRLVEVLGALAESTREDVAMRLRVEAGRASARSSVRTVVVFSVAFACVLAVAAHSYLAPFGTAVGQLVLMAVGSCYTAGLALMVWMVRPQPVMRLLEAHRRP